jgi:hypothetical protein
MNVASVAINSGYWDGQIALQHCSAAHPETALTFAVCLCPLYHHSHHPATQPIRRAVATGMFDGEGSTFRINAAAMDSPLRPARHRHLQSTELELDLTGDQGRRYSYMLAYPAARALERH